MREVVNLFRRQPLALFFLLLGFSLHVVLACRSWVGGDQIHLLRLGLEFSQTGTLAPFAKLTGGAGTNPGALLQLLVGIPLAVIPHYQSPMILVLFFHLFALFFVLRVTSEAFGNTAAVLTMVVFWLSPWRLYNGGFLWEPAYVFLPGALHFFSCWKLRDQSAKGPSFVLGLALIMAVQLHNSAFLLLILTTLLIVRKRIHVQWIALGLGAMTAGVTLIPTILALLAGDLPVTKGSAGSFGSGLVMVYPMLKGILYWFTLGSLDSVRMLNETVFLSDGWFGEQMWTSMLPPFVRILQALTIASVGISIVASWRFFRPLWQREQELEKGREWLMHYAGSTFVSLVISAALSPIVLQGWQVVIALHAATIPVIVWGVSLWERRKSIRSVGIPLYVGVQILIIVFLVSGHYIFRPGIIPPGVEPQKDLELLKLFPQQE
ncbi:MAG TPA: hypothetical protein VNN76_07825 [Bacteroidota bacterium]|nr:hypothetical protein [Bacteroidota bacterium]